MALLHVQFFSDVLGVSCSMDVILPQLSNSQIGMDSIAPHGKIPTLYLLHGLSDDHTIWQRRTSIERYVAGLPLAVVMPTVQRGFYTDMCHGPKYWTFISEELPRICESFFPLSSAREDRFAAGLSMGGYGALKLGLRCPDRYAAVASLSGVADLVFRTGQGQGDFPETPEGRDLFGGIDALRGSDNDLATLADKLCASSQVRPAIYMCCGTEDGLYGNNKQFVARFGNALHITWEEGPGIHEWGFWDQYIQRVLCWLPLRNV